MLTLTIISLVVAVVALLVAMSTIGANQPKPLEFESVLCEAKPLGIYVLTAPPSTSQKELEALRDNLIEQLSDPDCIGVGLPNGWTLERI
jgi:hypothetical protein